MISSKRPNPRPGTRYSDHDGVEGRDSQGVPPGDRTRCRDPRGDGTHVPRCAGHELGILDWEIAESYRQWVREYPDSWERRLRERYERDLPARDLHFVVGNLAKRRHTFEIIGLVRPPRSKMLDAGFVQESLDLMGEQRAVTRGRIGLEAEEADPLAADEGEQLLELFPGED
jgi:hypothetical protein